MHEKNNASEALWLKILDTVNLEIMGNNEYEMGISQAVVDFESMGQFPERIGGLFAALQKGLKEAEVDLLAVTLLILPYRMQNGSLAEPLIVLWNQSREARWASRFIGDDKRACQRAIDEACKEAGIQCPGPETHIVQVPYFVRPISDWKRDELDLDKVIYKTPCLFKDSARDSDWIGLHPGSQYIQRFLFTIICKSEEQRIQKLFLADEGSYISHLLGAFFSWVGVAADEVTRFQVERVASFQLLRAHQLGNELKALFNFERQNLKIMEQAGTSPTPETIRKIRVVLRAWRRILNDLTAKMAEFSQVASTVGAQRAEFNWYAEFTRCLESFDARPNVDNLIYSAEGIGKWQTPSMFDLF